MSRMKGSHSNICMIISNFGPNVCISSYIYFSDTYFFVSGRPCSVSDVLSDLVGAIRPLARRQQRLVELSELTHTLQVAVEEPALRQALSNLIEGALLRTQVDGRVEILSTGAPAGGALVVIDDDGPDMHYMVTICP